MRVKRERHSTCFIACWAKNAICNGLGFIACLGGFWFWGNLICCAGRAEPLGLGLWFWKWIKRGGACMKTSKQFRKLAGIYSRYFYQVVLLNFWNSLQIRCKQIVPHHLSERALNTLIFHVKKNLSRSFWVILIEQMQIHHKGQ